MTHRFCRYVSKVFHLPEYLTLIRDSRKKPVLSPRAIWMSALFMFTFRMRSLNAADGQLRLSGYLSKLIFPVQPSADTMGRVFALMDPEPLRDILSKINHTLKRNKALRDSRGLRFVAVDGHELFKSRSRCCSGCLVRKLTVNGVEVTEYYHRIVACHLIGFKIPVPLDVDPILPGENEVSAAKRLIERVLTRYARFFDVIVADALYLESPFINFCLEHKKHLIAVLKANCPSLLEDAKGLFEKIDPARSYTEGGATIQIWDEEGFNTLEHAKVPLRIVHTHEQEVVRKRVARQWVQKTQVHDRWWATTLPKSELSPEGIRWAARHRWDVENDLFNTLVTHWDMNHCFKHDPKAIINFLLTLLVAFVLVQSFYHLNLKSPMRHQFTLIAITALFLMNLASETFSLSWLESLPDP